MEKRRAIVTRVDSGYKMELILFEDEILRRYVIAFSDYGETKNDFMKKIEETDPRVSFPIGSECGLELEEMRKELLLLINQPFLIPLFGPFSNKQGNIRRQALRRIIEIFDLYTLCEYEAVANINLKY
jgi:hypothetical protein